MRYAVLNTYIDLLDQADVLHAIRENPGGHVAFLGAGLSKEANVPLAYEICEDIRQRLLIDRKIKDVDAWAREKLFWDDPQRRYTACLDAYGPAEHRVVYFRRLLAKVRPAFAHHAIALLMSRGILFGTALTTNFDKLLERAFVEQGTQECQAIRIPEETEYWGQELDKCYVFKLHGDYDTHNILNTRPETRSIPSFFHSHVLSILRARGLFVLGSAGNEESIIDFIKMILSSDDPRVLSGGLRWGVFVGPQRLDDMTIDDEILKLKKAIEGGAVSRQLVELLGDMNDQFGDRRPCSFFPVWGSGNLLLNFIENANDKGLSDAARLLLDHPIRLHAIFRAQNLKPDVIEDHIKKLKKAQSRLGLHPESPDQPIREAFRFVSNDQRTEVRVSYGDITSESMMGSDEFSAIRRAVVSPEDTTISAGGGVALRILTKAGTYYLLNELSKLSPIEHGTCAVTSAGNIPVHYIIHAAALKICPDGSYDITSVKIMKTIEHVLAYVETLNIGVLWIPLLGAGVAHVPALESLRSILSAIATSDTCLNRRIFIVVIFQESIISIDAARATAETVLGEHFSIRNC